MEKGVVVILSKSCGIYFRKISFFVKFCVQDVPDPVEDPSQGVTFFRSSDFLKIDPFLRVFDCMSASPV